MMDIDDEFVAPLLDAINKSVGAMPNNRMADAAGALIGAGVGLAIGMGISEDEVRGLVSNLVDTMMQVHKANAVVSEGGDA